MHTSNIFTPDFSTKPFWLDGLAPVAADPPAFPASADLVVIGSGYTGLHAALIAARAGLQVVVLEAGEIGAGCSTRNGGQISAAIKPGFTVLSKRFGVAKARAIQDEGLRSVEWLADFIQAEEIDCDYQACGSFHGAHSERHFHALKSEIEAADRLRRSGGRVVELSEMAQEIGTQRYYGGAVFPGDASLHPARYHRGLLQKVLQAGAGVYAQTPALDIVGARRARSGAPSNLDKSAHATASSSKLIVSTSRGDIQTRDVFVATNGYTGSVTPWLRRRVLPIGSYIIATQALDPSLINQLLPTDRVICDTRKVVYYYRVSPDRQRIIFGGRVSASETDALVSAPLLRRELCYLFPPLEQVQISHSWMGYVAFTFDSLPKCGQHSHIHYAMGYCGSGIALASYLGMRTAQALIGQTDAGSALHNLAFPTRTLYFGKPWFLGAAVKYYQWRDRIA